MKNGDKNVRSILFFASAINFAIPDHPHQHQGAILIILQPNLNTLAVKAFPL